MYSYVFIYSTCIVWTKTCRTKCGASSPKRKNTHTFCSLDTHHVCFSLGGVLADGEVQGLCLFFHAATNLRINRFLTYFSVTHTRKSLCCVPHQGEVGFGDGAVLEAAVSSAGGGLIEGDAKRPARGEIQLMTEPVERNTARLSIRTLTFT